jgi:hypothetical protein
MHPCDAKENVGDSEARDKRIILVAGIGFSDPSTAPIDATNFYRL